ncbi:MAG: type II toxin-antitoxin system ParD family antitoxin [Planctomycetes bacterium]|nr:type II toxin-antitoxin system ParD family antitoxin [Planctomycetota bacterium]
MRSSLNISLPQTMRAWVDDQIARGGYGTVSEYFRQLLREEQKRQLREQIDAKLLAAIESGEPIPVTPRYWDRLSKEARKRLARKRAR